MSKNGLAFGLNVKKKAPTKPSLAKKPMFGADDDSDENDDARNGAKVQIEETIMDLDDFDAAPTNRADDSGFAKRKTKPGPTGQAPKLKSQGAPTSTMFGDLSTSLTARRNAEAAAEVDASVYEYDAVYDSLKPKPAADKAEQERKPKYMRGLMQAADVRKRDALIAEEKKIAREREEEGDQYQDKDKFVTAAYKKQQEENRRIEEEEKRKEEAEAKRNEGAGMASFYKNLLNKDSARHAEAVKASEEAVKDPARATTADAPAAVDDDDGGDDEGKAERERIKKVEAEGTAVALNEDGQVVDKRQLLKGGLNLAAKKGSSGNGPQLKASKDRATAERDRRGGYGQGVDRKQAMRERQSRMVAEQLEESLKRSREQEDAQRAEVEREAKSRKTEGDISSARDRYLARKKAAEEAKKSGKGDGDG